MNFKFLRFLAIVLVLAISFAIDPADRILASSLNPAADRLLAANSLDGAIEKAEGKVQQVIGNLKGDREAQIAGKVKQAEGNIRATDPSNPSEAEIEGKTQQAESNIRRYQTPDHKSSNLKDALD